jgi:predicted RNase H-like nuclease
MYEEAASLASTILKQQQQRCLRDNDDMLQSTAMVLLQAFNHLGRQLPFPIFPNFNLKIIIIIIIIID